MKWVLIAIAFVVALVSVVGIVGALLPERHVASGSATLDAPPEEVWAVITAFEEAPAWRPGVKRMERLPDRNGHPVWVEVGRQGRLTYEVTEIDPPRHMVTVIADPELPFGGSWTYDLVPEGTGTRVTITEKGEIYNPIFRFMARFVFGYDGTLRRYLNALSERLGRTP
ncbi:MAG: SRPBCC family protein [Gemmatimonadota bacterium]